MRIREYIDIVEQALNEEQVSIFRMAYRSWYNFRTEQWVAVSPSGSHVKDVLANPEAFGIPPEELEGGTDKDRDPVVMDAMCRHGWIRVAAAERNDPGKFIILEGANMKQMDDLFATIMGAFRNKIDNIVFKVRRAGGVAREYQINGREQVNAYFMGEHKPKPITTQNDQIHGDSAKQDLAA